MWAMMAKAFQLAIEVHYVPLSASALQERRARLLTLLLRGTLRLVQKLPGKPETTEADSVEFVPK